MKFKLSLILLFLTIPLLAQNSDRKQVTVKGTVLEEGTNYPLEYTTVSFTDAQGQIVTGGITDLDGNYSIKIPVGRYVVKYEFISYKTKTLASRNFNANTSLPLVKLDLDAASLDEVIVRAETTEVQVRLDKKIYNIGKDLTAGGATVSDALNNVPSVTVDVEGAIALRGNENVRILINGKPSALAGFGSTDALRQLPADAIERVEVITSPSARYDAEGTAGIINIILKKEKTLGVNGSLTTSMSAPLTSSASANINLRTDKFNIFNTTGVSFRGAPGNAQFNNNYFAQTFTDPVTGEVITKEPMFDRVTEDRIYDRDNRNFNTNLGIEYFITEKSSLTASGFLSFGKRDNFTTNKTGNYSNKVLLENITRNENQLNDNNYFQLALNYVNNLNDNGHKLTADLQYNNSKDNATSLIYEDKTFPLNLRLPSEDINTDQSQKSYLAQMDYVLPMGDNAQFEAGYRGNFDENITDYQLFQEVGTSGSFNRNDSLSNIFTYEQNVNAVYSQYGNKFGKLSFLVGLRLEHTQLKGKVDAENFSGFDSEELNFDKNYLDLFPTVNLTYELKDNENITLGYNRRINRPNNWYINPFPSRSSETNVFQGNPDLDPAFSDAFDLGYLKRWKKFTLTTSIYYQHETDAYERVREETGEVTGNGIRIIRTLPINLSTNERYGFEIGGMYNPTKWLQLNGSFNLYESKTEGFYNDVDYGNESSSYFARFSGKVKFPGKLDWQTNAFYRGASESAQTKTDGMLSFDMALSKDIMKDDATLTLSVSDLFDTRKRNSYTFTDTFTSDSEFQWRGRQVSLSFTYRFNQQKQQRQRNARGGNNGGGMDEGGFEG